MKFETVVNLVLVSVLAYTLGKHTQRKKDSMELEALFEELKKEASKPRKVSYSPYHHKKYNTYSSEHPPEFLFKSKEEASKIIDEALELINNYGQISVADLYELVGVPSNFQDNNYGWKSIKNVKIKSSSIYNGGTYILEFPKAEKLN